MATPPARALLLHTIAGRARLRIEGRETDAAFMSSLSAALLRCAGVREVRANAVSGSLLVLHDGELQPILDYARERGLFEVVSAPPRATMRRLRDAIENADASVAAGTNDSLSVGKVAFVALVGAGLWQASQGRLLPAGMTLFNYAIGVMGWVADREPASSQGRP